MAKKKFTYDAPTEQHPPHTAFPKKQAYFDRGESAIEDADSLSQRMRSHMKSTPAMKEMPAMKKMTPIQEDEAEDVDNPSEELQESPQKKARKKGIDSLLQNRK